MTPTRQNWQRRECGAVVCVIEGYREGRVVTVSALLAVQAELGPHLIMSLKFQSQATSVSIDPMFSSKRTNICSSSPSLCKDQVQRVD